MDKNNLATDNIPTSEQYQAHEFLIDGSTVYVTFPIHSNLEIMSIVKDMLIDSRIKQAGTPCKDND